MAGAMSAGTGGGTALHESPTARCSAPEHGTQLSTTALGCGSRSEETAMSSLYAMQRANGDWFALDDHGRLRMPVFHSSNAAMHARIRHPGMLLFKPKVFD